MRIHHLNCGTFCPLGQLLINGEGSPFASGELVCHCLALETSQGIVLVDTGLGTRDIADPIESLPGPIWRAINRPELDLDETMLFQLAARNIRPDDVRHIVLTHLDFDHAGGIADFPFAEIHVLQEEHDAATHPRKWIDHQRYAPNQFNHMPRWHMHTTVAGETWLGFEAVRALAGTDDEVLLVPLPGHSRGHCGVAVRTPGGWLLHAGDAFFHHSELEGKAPLGLRIYENIFQDDRALRKQNQERLRELSGHPGVEIICSHDPVMLHALSGSENRAYVA